MVVPGPPAALAADPPATGPRHVPALDGLRGAAVVAVVAFHLGLLRGGYLGVDLFFTLSGFLITRLLVEEWTRHGRVDLRRFWARRFRRLLPALLLVLAAVAVASRRWASATTFDRLRVESYASLAYVANWRAVAAGTDYWDEAGRPSPVQHLWSLSIEEQFYVLWPLLVAGLLAWHLRHAARRPDGDPLGRLLAATLALAGLSAAAALAGYARHGDANRVYFGTDTRAVAVLLGAALALLLARHGPVAAGRPRAALEAAAVVASAGLAWAWWTLPGRDPLLYRGGLLACGLAATVVLLAVADPRPGPLGRVLSFPPLCWLGLISYGIYLWHWPVIVFVTPGRTGWFGGQLVAARLALTLGLALASYALVERPIRHGAGSGAAMRVAAPVAVAAVVGLVAWSTAGAVAPVGDRGGGRNVLKVADSPVPPVVPGRPRLLVVGDSGAWSLRVPLGVVAPDRGVDAVSRGTPACGVVPGDGRAKRPDGSVLDDPPRCERWPERWRDHLREVRPTTALLFSVAPGGAARFVDGAWRKDCDPAYDAAAQREYERALRLLATRAHRVAIATVAYLESESDADGRYPEVDCRNRTIRAAARATGATVVDVARWTCPAGGACRDRVDTLDGRSVELRPDGLHYDGPGGVVAVRWILDRLGYGARR